MPGRRRGRPPKRERQRIFLEAIGRSFVFGRACAAAGVTRLQAVEWTQDRRFLLEFTAARLDFCDRMESALIQAATGRGSRVLRSSMAAMQTFLSTHHEDYFRSRMEAALRAQARIVDEVAAILKKHTTPDVQAKVREAFDRMRQMSEFTGGSKLK